jgi:hypothetical protein
MLTSRRSTRYRTLAKPPRRLGKKPPKIIDLLAIDLRERINGRPKP